MSTSSSLPGRLDLHELDTWIELHLSFKTTIAIVSTTGFIILILINNSGRNWSAQIKFCWHCRILQHLLIVVGPSVNWSKADTKRIARAGISCAKQQIDNLSMAISNCVLLLSGCHRMAPKCRTITSFPALNSAAFVCRFQNNVLPIISTLLEALWCQSQSGLACLQ